MNVSSVKNLNGEVFSAVQDASLTNVVQTNSGNWQDITAYQSNSASYLTAHQDLTPYQTIEGMTAYQPVGSYATTNELEQVSADITATIPSTAGLASESYVQTNSAVLTGMIDGKQDTLTFGYDEQDRINSINSSALAGGGDVPEDVMVETNLEYNAVNEISGYNGSAIAQYGAEKQWLVHDDTLVHAANSAQYALGVAIDNVARLMGVDETLLWSGDDLRKYTNIELSGSPSAYNKIKVIYGSNITQSSTGNKLFGSLEYYTSDCPILILNGVLRGSSTARYVAEDTWTGINTTAWDWTDGALWQFGSTAVQTANNKWCNPYRIYGIGRKQ